MAERGTEIFEVESIFDKRSKNGCSEYYVKWLGYPEAENTWEPAENLSCLEIIKDFEDKLRKNKKRKAPRKSPGYIKRSHSKTTTSTGMALVDTCEPVAGTSGLNMTKAFPRNRTPSRDTRNRPSPDGVLEGFEKMLQPVTIMGAVQKDNQLMFLIMWLVYRILETLESNSICDDTGRTKPRTWCPLWWPILNARRLLSRFIKNALLGLRRSRPTSDDYCSGCP